MNQEQIKKGIAAYAHEQAAILRLLRKRGSFTERDFDKWLLHKRPKLYRRGITGDTLILGMGANGGTQWALWLDLMQHMMAVGLIDAKKEHGLVVYKPL